MPGARIRLTAPPPHEHQPIGPARRQLNPRHECHRQRAPEKRYYHALHAYRFGADEIVPAMRLTGRRLSTHLCCGFGPDAACGPASWPTPVAGLSVVAVPMRPEGRSRRGDPPGAYLRGQSSLWSATPGSPSPPPAAPSRPTGTVRAAGSPSMTPAQTRRLQPRWHHQAGWRQLDSWPFPPAVTYLMIIAGDQHSRWLGSGATAGLPGRCGATAIASEPRAPHGECWCGAGAGEGVS
jgi:hypothetical protein